MLFGLKVLTTNHVGTKNVKNSIEFIINCTCEGWNTIKMIKYEWMKVNQSYICIYSHTYNKYVYW